MKFFRTKIAQLILFYICIFLVAISLTGKTTLSLPFFYNQTPQQRLLTFGTLTLAFGILVYFSSRIFILPNLRRFLQWKHLLFIVLCILLLSIMLGINSANYWSFPEIHTVEICFDAQNGDDPIRVQKLVESNTNRLYPPDSFSSGRYPLNIRSGECINGRIVYLPSLLTRALIVPRLSVFVNENPPEGRFYVSINEAPAVVYFDPESDSQTGNEIFITDGFNKGQQMAGPWKQYWFLGLKAIGVGFSAVFLSLSLFGFTEKILTGTKDNLPQAKKK